MAKKIYLATPVNGRKEKKQGERQWAAMNRIDDMASYLRTWFPDAEIINPIRAILIYHNGSRYDEAHVMGHCVRMVMESDIVILDDGWENSKGCTVERFVALQYGKQVYTFNHFKLKEKLNQ